MAHRTTWKGSAQRTAPGQFLAPIVEMKSAPSAPDRCRGHLPRPGALIRLVGAVLAEQHDEWTEARGYLGVDLLARSQAVNAPDAKEDTANTPAITTAA